MKTPQEVSALVREELARIKDPKIGSRLAGVLVLPYPSERGWDYGKPGEKFVCWVVLEHRRSNTAIGYCEEGFGPRCSWGLLSLTGPCLNMGMDSGWFSTLEDAFKDSWANQDQEPNQPPEPTRPFGPSGSS